MFAVRPAGCRTYLFACSGAAPLAFQPRRFGFGSASCWWVLGGGGGQHGRAIMPAAARSWTWACGCCAGRRRRRRKTGGGGGEAGASGRAEEGDEWSLFMDLHVLEAATDGFSDDNLLGRGGFGPVYKAILSSLPFLICHFCLCVRLPVEDFCARLILLEKRN